MENEDSRDLYIWAAKIACAAADVFGVSFDDVMGAGFSRGDVKTARDMTYWILNKVIVIKPKAIAAIFKAPALSVSSLIRIMDVRMDNEPELMEKYRQIMRILHG